jgi:hypothetical protein
VHRHDLGQDGYLRRRRPHAAARRRKPRHRARPSDP